MNSEYLNLEDAKKLANYDKLLSENTMLKSNNQMLLTKAKEVEKKYQKILNEKNKKIKELEEENKRLKYKQADMFGG